MKGEIQSVLLQARIVNCWNHISNNVKQKMGSEGAEGVADYQQAIKELLATKSRSDYECTRVCLNWSPDFEGLFPSVALTPWTRMHNVCSTAWASSQMELPTAQSFNAVLKALRKTCLLLKASSPVAPGRGCHGGGLSQDDFGKRTNPPGAKHQIVPLPGLLRQAACRYCCQWRRALHLTVPIGVSGNCTGHWRKCVQSYANKAEDKASGYKCATKEHVQTGAKHQGEQMTVHQQGDLSDKHPIRDDKLENRVKQVWVMSSDGVDRATAILSEGSFAILHLHDFLTLKPNEWLSGELC
eukprot:XP_013982028.1 PREDICTED: uncharacterized protein LOC106562025 [Salmo salar]